jgi:molybdenum cofactor synthesis domain-containing protein
MDSAGILVIGNEVLSGKVEEANARFLIGALREAGVRLERIVFVRDDEAQIASDVREMASRVDHLFTSGGVGGTHDDITMPAVARAFDLPLETHPELMRLLEAHYGERLNDAHRRVARLPRGATLHYAESSPVPVVRVRNVFVLPGAPRFLRDKFPAIRPLLQGSEVWLAELRLCVDEEAVADVLEAADALVPGVEVGSYPRFEGGDACRVKVTIEGTREADAARVLEFLRGRIEAQAVLEAQPPRLAGGGG